MSISKPSELLEFLKSEGATALKGLSQNFLIDQNIVKKILVAAAVKKDDAIIEIGPGPGALTQALLEVQAQVTAIELDHKFAKLLERLQTKDKKLEIFPENALEIPLESLFKNRQPAKLVSNLPYHLTTPLLARFLPLYPRLQSITVMLQKEVAERIVAEPGSRNASSLSLFVRLFSQPKYCFDVTANCFYPKPKVTSSVVHFALHSPPKDIDPKQFEKLLRTCFTKRRKMLRSSLKNLCDPNILTNSSINPTTRPEQLSMTQFVELYHLILTHKTVPLPRNQFF